MEDALANLRLLDDEEEAIQEDEGAMNGAYQFYLVGRCLTDSVVHFPSLRNTMADLWHPIGGICITELGEKWYLFQFFIEVDIERVVAGKPWFFNNHLLILQKIPSGENPAALELNFTEFWVQVHELPPRLMTESMAKQFGDFCGKFIEYDTSIPLLGIQKFLRIRVFLDVIALLKRKKKVLMRKSMIVYARFKYDKLSLFCFICGKLVHGESYCPFRLQIEPSKIVFGWDLSLRAVVRRQNTAVNRRLRAADGSPCVTENLVSFNHGISINEGKDLGHNFRGIVGNQNLNPNLIPLGSVQYHSNNRQIKGRDGDNDALVADGLVNGPMDLVLDEEDDPIALLKGKKRQRIVEGPRVLLDAIAGLGSLDVSTSSAKKIELVRLKCRFENGIDVGAIGTRGGLSLGWRENTLAQLKSFSSFHIDVEVHDNECGEIWRLTGFYGNLDERSGRLRSNRQTREFREALDDCSLTDLGFVGWWFTWERGRFVSTNIRERLDRGVAILSWVNLFLGYRLEHLRDGEKVVDDNFGSVLGKLEELGHHLLKWSKSTTREEEK
ncbi:hypothetical protein Gohar_015512 [Gossypium harknessii]|uniref:DUF4283 domain-containing protein n=1 Tax=Gossypium harknessii TaxID=34285 RepID=A0A7J9G013_9ROSI|nr:hypothetical protein [Gossypium harknessii]